MVAEVSPEAEIAAVPFTTRDGDRITLLVEVQDDAFALPASPAGAEPTGR